MDSGPGLVAWLIFRQQRGFQLGRRTAQYLMTGMRDEPAALAFVLDEESLQPGGCTAESLAIAACRYGRMDSLLLHERGWLVPDHIEAALLLRICAAGKQPATAVWLVDNLCGGGPSQHPDTEELFAAAADVGSVPLLRQLRERGCPWDASAWQLAVFSGCVALLRWLHNEGCPRPVRDETSMCALR